MSQKHNINQMSIGDQITLKDDEVLQVKFLQVLQTRPTKNQDKRGNAIVPTDYARMRFGSVAFTINTEEDVAIVANPESRDDIYSMTLEVSDIAEPRIDPDSGEALMDGNNNPIVDHRKGLTFVNLVTYTSKTARDKKRVTNEGTVHAERVKYGLPISGDANAIGERMAEMLAAKAAAAQAAPEPATT